MLIKSYLQSGLDNLSSTKGHMKHLLISIALLVFGFSVLFGQIDTNKTSLFIGSKALQFQIGSDFTLDGFDGALISYKKHTSANKAWRVGITLSARHSDLHTDVKPYDSNRVFLNEVVSVVNIQTMISVQHYKEVKKQIAFYYGYGFAIGFYHQWYSPLQYQVSTLNEYSIGPIGYVGVEWFLRENLSILGEYGCVGRYKFSYVKYDYETTPEQIKHKVTSKGHSFSLEQQPVKLGVSFYF
jgi:hypothetical protein